LYQILNYYAGKEFIAQFPDGGNKVIERRASIYVVDTQTLSQHLICNRPSIHHRSLRRF